MEKKDANHLRMLINNRLQYLYQNDETKYRQVMDEAHKKLKCAKILNESTLSKAEQVEDIQLFCNILGISTSWIKWDNNTKKVLAENFCWDKGLV